MDLSQARRFQSLAGRAGLMVGILLVAAMLDVVIARHRTDFNVMHVLPGQVEPIDGPLAEKTSVEELTYQSDSPDLKVAFDETHAGFWMGGQMWRGKLLVGSQIQPGKYTLSVRPKNPVSDRPPLVYRVTVYPDYSAWRQSSKSYLTRYGGLSPWWVIAFSFGSLALLGGVSFSCPAASTPSWLRAARLKSIGSAGWRTAMKSSLVWAQITACTPDPS